MNTEAINTFLSEDNIKRHLEYMHTLSLRLSIIEKSFPELKGKTISDVSRMRLEKDVRGEFIYLRWLINAHELFFDSYSLSPKKSESVKRDFGSRERFIYEIYTEIKSKENGFAFIYLDRGRVRFDFCTVGSNAFVRYTPTLAIDLYEHTYFSDYGFNKDRFLRAALTYLDTGRLI